MAEPKRKTVYKAKYTGKVYNTAREAALDNARYLREPINRFDVKSKEYPKYRDFSIPFIKEKKRTLTNAGLATGAVISENLLDSIAKYAAMEGLPLKTALGLATKESTLGNPTDDNSVYKLLGKDKAMFFKRGGRGQFINKEGQDVYARTLVNYYKDTWNPYEETIKIAKQKATGHNEVFVKPNDWGNPNNPHYLKALDKYNKQKAIFDKVLINGEHYADKQAEKRKDSITGNVLQAAFRDYKNNPNSYNPGQPNYPQLVEKRGNEVWNSPEVQSWYKRSLEDGRNKKPNGGIHIAPSKRGTLTAAATRHGMSPLAFAHKVMSNKDNYSSKMVKKANFAINFNK